MRLRTQLILACFLLSVLPLTGIVVYSYRSSRDALESAYHHEARRMTEVMDRRITTIRNDLDKSLAQVSTLPLQNIPANAQAGAPTNAVVENILMTMGETASLVDTLEFLPARPATPPTRETPAAEAPAPQAPEAPRRPARRVTVEVAQDPEPEVHVESESHPIELPEIRLLEPIVIELPPRPKMPKFTFTPEQKVLMAEVGKLAGELGKWDQLTPEQRSAIQKELGEKQKLMHESLAATRKNFEQEMATAQAAMREYEQQREAVREQARARRDAERAREKALAEGVLTPELEAEARARKEREDKLRALIAAPPKKPETKTAKAKPKNDDSEAVVKTKKSLTTEEKAKLTQSNKQAGLLLGKRFNVPVHGAGGVIGSIRANISTQEVVKRVLGSGDDRSEVTFAVDRENNLYTRTPQDRETIEQLGIPKRIRENKRLDDIEGWIVALTQDKESGLRVGVARRVGENLVELRNTAARNYTYGLGLIVLAMIGIIPLSNHISRDVNLVANGAQRIAQGDLMTRLPVRSNNEFGRLASAFNRMAEDLSHHQQRILEQERDRKEQEMQQRFLALEYERKSVELEDARRFQLSMLPKELPRHPRFEVAVFIQTATEVGGDYYDFHVSRDGVLSATIGDATGHGAKAGTMVTVIKTLFAGYSPSTPPSTFLSDAAVKIKRMDLGRMAMALSVARFEDDRVTVSSAGMPPLLVHRKATGEVEELALNATPLGTLGVEYDERSTTIARGDTILLMTDGFPELQNATGTQLGYAAALQEFATAATALDAAGVIAALAETSKRWHGEAPPNDDITFVVVRAR